ncbi:MAG: aldo/keto reductase [Bacillus subtilis]|nr:aldo/keto reductase [Bacillus subtilis]
MNNRVSVPSRRFRGIEHNPSLLGFGCMRFPTISPDSSEIDEVMATKMIDLAMRRGVTYYDTAYIYHHGQSETFLGSVLKNYPRDSFYLADKMPSWMIQSRDDAERIFQDQLRKCQVDYFDYYLCHALGKENFKPYLKPEIWSFLQEMKSQGKIRHLGFSFHDTPEVFDEIIQTYTWDFAQIQLNYLDWTLQDAKRLYASIERAGIPCIVMEPVRGGMLATLSADAVAILKEAAPDRSVASWAIRYAASKPNVMVVLSGMSNEAQTEDNLTTMSPLEPLSDTEQAVLDQALAAFVQSKTIPCTACRYCMPCPSGVDIPGMFHHYNRYAIGKNKWELLHAYESATPGSNAANCIECGECLSLCPQKIAIPTKMRELQSLIQSLQSK